MDGRGPFILLDDARGGGAARPARLYRDPVETLEAWTPEELATVLARIEAARREGLHVAGMLAYDAGLALEAKLHPLLSERAVPPRLCWFGLFGGYEAIAPEDVASRLGGGTPSGGTPSDAPLIPRLSPRDYARAFRTVQRAIAAGDIYQANLTFMADMAFSGDPLELYAALRSRAGSGYGGLLFDGREHHLNFSPELFFTTEGATIAVRPMKGTAPRDPDPERDHANAEGLARSEKDRAENLMIVDLMRNDLSRIAEPGSVATKALFRIETYPAIHQMTSTVTARLAPDAGFSSIVRAIFPCGSITGAPKIRAMQILETIERAPRGVYCGAIGRIDPPGPDGRSAAAFNVAIRNLHFSKSRPTVTLGLGSGIVADSVAGKEWRECAVKGAFVAPMARPFDLIETMAFDPASGIVRLEAHLERMKTSAAALGFSFDRHAARNAVHGACFLLDAPTRVRLLLARSGATAIETGPLPEPPERPWRVMLSPAGLSSGDFRRRHKTSDRAHYDAPRRAAAARGCDEVVFVDGEGMLTEGSFTHIFVPAPGGGWRTPPLSRGLLPGVLRAEMLASGEAVEADLTAGDLSQGFRLGNAVRGLVKAELLAPQE